MKVGWEHFAHDADVGVRGVGATVAEAFEQGGLALTAVATDPSWVRPAEAVEIACQGNDLEELFFEWLNALVYEMSTRRVLFGRFQVRIDDERLAATVWGEPVEVARHHPAVEVKGATFTSLRVAREEGGLWIAQCVVDV